MNALVLLALLAAADGGVVDSALDAGPPPIEPRVTDDADAGVDADAADAGPAVTGLALGLTLSARVEPDPVDFGAPFELVVEIMRPRGTRVGVPQDLPSPDKAPRSGDVMRSVVELPPPPAPAGDAGPDAAPPVPPVQETLRVPFLALDLEELATPAFTLTLEDGSTLEVPSLPVRVNPATPPENPKGDDGKPVEGLVLDGAAGPIAYPVRDDRPLALLLLVGFAVAWGMLVRAIIRRRRLQVPVRAAPPPPPSRPAHEVALERLQRLMTAGLLQSGHAGVFVERLMDEVLRDYVTGRFALPAGSRTTRELCAELLTLSVAGLDVKLVESLLFDADLIKFARGSIGETEAHAMAVRVRTLIEATALRATAAANTTTTNPEAR